MPRSGTSLLNALLDAHPEVLSLGETHVYKWATRSDPVAGLFKGSYYRDWYPEGTSARRSFEQVLRQRLPAPTPTARALTELSVVRQEHQGMVSSELWIDKTPRNYCHLSEILRDFGAGTRVVFLVRDPRDVVASHLQEWSRPWRGVAKRWAEAESMAVSFRGHPAVHIVHYEELVADPEAVMGVVAEHLGLEWDPSLLRPTFDGRPWKANSCEGRGEWSITSRFVGRFRRDLSRSQVDWIERSLDRRMQRQGYQLQGSRRAFSAPRFWLDLRCAYSTTKSRTMARGGRR